MLIVLLFIFGLFIGSFLNVIIDRLPRGENFLIGRSHCDFCLHILSWYDLIPFFSFVFLLGKCRYCHKFIGWKYPLIEFTTGIVFATTAYIIGINNLLFLLITLVIVSCLIVIFYIDFFCGIIPDIILFILLFFSILRIIFFLENFLTFILTSFFTGLFFLFIFFLTKKKGIGFGDVKYGFVMGFLVGFPKIIPSLYIAFLTGAFISLILIVVRRKSLKSSIAFGPFLVLGTIANIFFGTQIWIIFQKLLGI